MHPPLKARNMVDPKEMDELRKELARTVEEGRRAGHFKLRKDNLTNLAKGYF